MRVATDVISRKVGDEVVLLDLQRGVYFGLDEIGARVWTLLSSGNEPAEIVAALAREFEAPVETIDVDVRKLLGELRDEGLIVE